MSKAILVMDTPKKCSECDICQHEDEGWLYCTYCHRNAHAFNIPDWCPLKPMPEEIDVPDFDDTIKANNKNAEEVGMYMYDRGIYRGYNMCINKIL